MQRRGRRTFPGEQRAWTLSFKSEHTNCCLAWVTGISKNTDSLYPPDGQVRWDLGSYHPWVNPFPLAPSHLPYFHMSSALFSMSAVMQKNVRKRCPRWLRGSKGSGGQE